MLFALLAKIILGRPPLVQAVVLGLCTGLFVSAMASANLRDPVLSRTAVLVLAWGAVAGVGYYVGLTAQRRNGSDAGTPRSRGLYLLYAAVWIFGLLAALRALLGEGGFKVAALAIVPLVLLAPAALYGIRSAIRSDAPAP